MALSGQKTVMTAGAAEALGSQRICAPHMLKALTTNTSLANIVNDGAADVSSIFPTFKRANVQTPPTRPPSMVNRLRSASA